MLKWIMIPLMAITIVGCSQIPNNPAIAFGKKCDVTDSGTIVSSSVWFYDKETGLKATKEACPKKD